ncbi:MAG: NAD(P)/FAD-dependent oxidoreductase [Desulfuromonas sp.]|nr:MAG: NAD(P)/FAD-dependent oxidoreductase [Desulfuromonas sp.]
MTQHTTQPRIVILGGGYAGVSAAVRLGGTSANVVLVNKHSYHHLTTLLHQPAVGRRGYTDLSVGLREVLPSCVDLVRGRVMAITPEQKSVTVKTRQGEKQLTYDYLVLALGWEAEFYQIPGLREHALTLEDLNTSRLTKDRIEEALIAFDENPEQGWRRSIVIGGGGLSGVELAGELADSRQKFATAFDLKPEDISIHLVDGAPGLLHGLDPWLSQETTAYLTARGVQVHSGTRISQVKDRAVVFENGNTLEAGTVIWTGGVRANRLVERAGFAGNRQGRAEVDAFLRSKAYPEVFIIGDCALVNDAQGNPLPPTAQLAVQQGVWTARNLRRVIKGKALQPYKAVTRGIVLSIGRRYALGVVNGYRISGVPAGMLKDAIAYKYLFSIGGPLLTLKKWWSWAAYASAMRRS